MTSHPGATPAAVLTDRPESAPARPDGLLHGAVLRPPVLAWDGRRYRGARLQALDAPDPQALPGVIALVRQESFVGVVAASDILARQAAALLQPVWLPPPSVAAAEAATPTDRSPTGADPYEWQLPAGAPASGDDAMAWCSGSHLTAWLPCPAARRAIVCVELARLLGLDPSHITLVDSTPGRNAPPPHPLDVLDAVADAALLSQAVGRPVRMPLRAPATAGTLRLRPDAVAATTAATEAETEAEAATANARPAPAPSSTTLALSMPWAVRPSLARLLSAPAQASPSEAPQVQARLASTWEPTPPAPSLPRASAADLDAARIFAEQSWLDEQAAARGADPLAHRLATQPPGPLRALTEQLARRAGWLTTDEDGARRPTAAPAGDGRLHGRGYADAEVRQDGTDTADAQTCWSAWIAEVAVDPASGAIDITRVVVGHDSQDLHTAHGARIQAEETQLLAAARRLLAAPARFDDWGARSTPPAATAEPAADTTPLARRDGSDVTRPPVDDGALAVDGVLTLPAAAAIANAVFDATGVRLRQVPFTPEQLRLALDRRPPPSARRWLRRGAAWLAAGAGAAVGLLAMAWPVKPAIAPIDGPDVTLYSAAAIERGRLVAAAGDCVVCHTAPDGARNAGGLGLDTPFGTIYSTNITPDRDTGIGRWSYSAFERAMREGVHRDGRQLYPAFPYTAFAKMTEADMQALYGYLMTQPAVRATPPETQLAFPYNLRPSLAGWNLLFHDNSVYQPEPDRSLAWNRGAYLVQGAGHCAACHSPRNALGAEKRDLSSYLAGGEAEGWSAPALNQLAGGERPWSHDELSDYLRSGFSARHGVAAGPMAPVIHGLAELPESDVRAIATYLLELPGPATPQQEQTAQMAQTEQTAPAAQTAPQPRAAPPISTTEVARPAAAPVPVFDAHANGERLYQNACAVCHEAGSGPTLFGVKPSLAANTNLHSDTPDNLIQVILNGIQQPANGDLGYMPGFRDSLDDQQISELLGYLRARFAPQQPAWPDDLITTNRLRAH